MTASYLCDAADLSWQDGVPFSNRFEDIYWHRSGAIDEKQHVFVEPLLNQVGNVNASQQVTVCELGFGFGINCLLAAKRWQAKPKNTWLNLISIENHPVEKSVLQQYLKQFDFAVKDKLLEQYPLPYRGQHVIWLSSNIRLVLIFDEVETALSGLDAEVDFWFLDGFAPSRNDAMWQPSLYKMMFARSRSGAGVATYSAAGQVRRDLEKAGFNVSKREGYANKKEMLRALMPGTWHAKPHRLAETTIIGGGLAGRYCAEALNRRGVEAQLINSGQGASSIPQLAVKPQLAVRPEARYRFSLMAYQYMKSSPGYEPCGLHWIGHTQDEKDRLRRIAQQFPGSIMALQPDGSVLVDEAGWLSFQALVAADKCQSVDDEITTISQTADGWLLQGNQGSYASSNLILATGANRQLLPEQLEIRAIHGQSICIKTNNIQNILNDDISILPTNNGRSVVSGTYARRANLDADPADTKSLIDSARKLVEVDDEDVEVFTGVRAVSRDRLPIVGQAPDWQKLDEVGRPMDVSEFTDGLYYCTAFGSRGATHARLSAEQLVAKMFGEPAVLDLKQQQMQAPSRFHFRDRKLS